MGRILNSTPTPQAANTVYAGPTSGGSDIAAFRALVAADIPSFGLISVTDDNSTNATMYPVWVTSAATGRTVYCSTSYLQWNPFSASLSLTGTLNVTGSFNVTGNPAITGYVSATGGHSTGIPTDTSYSGYPGLSIYTISSATNSSTWYGSPYIAQTTSIWNGSAAVYKSIILGTGGVTGVNSAYGLNISSTDVFQIMFIRGDTGYVGIAKTTPATALDVNGTVTATAFVGALTGNVTGNCSGSAGSATNITTTNDTSTNATYYPTIQTATGGTNPLKTSSSKLTFNPSSGTLTATVFSGPLTGNVTGNCSGTAGSISGYNNPAVAATINTIVYRDGSGTITGTVLYSSYATGTSASSYAGLVAQTTSNASCVSNTTHQAAPYIAQYPYIWNGASAVQKVINQSVGGVSGQNSQYTWALNSSDVSNIIVVRGDTGFVGIGAGASTLFGVNGEISSIYSGASQFQVLTLANGYNNNVAITSSFVYIQGPTAGFTISGVVLPASASNGQEITFVNSTSQTMTITNNDTSHSTASNCILTIQAATINVAGAYGTFTIKAMSQLIGRWLMISHS